MAEDAHRKVFVENIPEGFSNGKLKQILKEKGFKNFQVKTTPKDSDEKTCTYVLCMKSDEGELFVKFIGFE